MLNGLQVRSCFLQARYEAVRGVLERHLHAQRVIERVARAMNIRCFRALLLKEMLGRISQFEFRIFSRSSVTGVTRGNDRTPPVAIRWLQQGCLTSLKNISSKTSISVLYYNPIDHLLTLFRFK